MRRFFHGRSAKKVGTAKEVSDPSIPKTGDGSGPPPAGEPKLPKGDVGSEGGASTSSDQEEQTGFEREASSLRETVLLVVCFPCFACYFSYLSLFRNGQVPWTAKTGNERKDTDLDVA